MDGPGTDPRERLLQAIRAYGRDAVGFQAVEDGIRVFEDPLGIVAYYDTGSAWLAVGSPLTAPSDVRALADRFAAAARAERRRVSFVGVEALQAFDGYTTILLGEQAVYLPSGWASALASKKSLREQIRRAKAKGVKARRVAPDELTPGSPLRERARELALAWLSSRRMEPLQFLVALEPFHAMDDHRYYVAEREGRVIAFASAIPIPARDGIMLEDVLRDDDVPNGTTELLFDFVMRDREGTGMVTLGLAPLTGEVAPWLRVVRDLTRPLYDFVGLRAFKERLLPSSWDRVHLALPPGESPLAHVIECLRAFAGGSFLRFGLLSLLRHPSGPPYALVFPLIAWILLRLIVAASGASAHFGANGWTIALWSILDVVLAVSLFRAAMRPRSRGLALATGVAFVVALRSAIHVAEVGFGQGVLDGLLRGILVVAPIVGTILLALATHRRRAHERGERPPIALPHF